MCLIGKVLNLKKKDDRITANDLGNGKFLLNFTSKEDLKSVLRKGQFHYNYCIFVLVRWEPILVGIPLHFWTVNKMKSIGHRLVHVDTIELSKGRMLIDVDSRQPLKFKRKVESPESEEVTIEIKYDMLFKHCTIHGLMTHEKGFCPTRVGVFARLQIPQDQPGHQPLLRDHRVIDHRNNEIAGRQPLLQNIVSRYLDVSRFNRGYKGIYHDHETETSQVHNRSDNNRYGGHSDRIIRGSDNKPRGVEPTWREKPKTKAGAMVSSPVQARNASYRYRDVVPYEQASTSNNVTIMTKSLALSLTFSPQASADALHNEKIFGVLNDMELLDSNGGGIMECDVQEDDLLGEELMDIEDKVQSSVVAGSSNANVPTKSTKSARSGS
ncbi:hypothetical protein N665_0592s0008 [Sinapis alba]|nr:hypothetical protein N665_0592s0008 [Sinapis alba]